MKRVPTNLLEPNIVKVLVLRVCHDFSYFEKRYAHLTFKQHRAAHRGCGTKGVPAAGVSEASEMLLLVVVVVLLLVVGFQLIRGLFFRGGMGMGG